MPEQDGQEEEDPIGALLSDPVFNQAPLSVRLSDSDKSEFFELVLRQKSLAREAAALSFDLGDKRPPEVRMGPVSQNREV